MNIKPGDFVLEIGSGNNPNPRSDVLADRYIFSNHERAGEFDAVIDRPMVVCDGYHLPFADKTFDYVICSHILEHIKDPKTFLEEVTRVGKAGYIEVPSMVSEKLFGWDFHVWYCDKKRNLLVLTKKTQGEQFGGFFHQLIANHVWFRRYFEEHEPQLYVRIEWKNSIQVELKHILDAKQEEGLHKSTNMFLASAAPHLTKDIRFFYTFFWRRVKRKIRKTIRLGLWRVRSVIYRESILKSLLPILQCPACKARELVYNASCFRCQKCHSTYPFHTAIPVLLRKDEIKKGY